MRDRPTLRKRAAVLGLIVLVLLIPVAVTQIVFAGSVGSPALQTLPEEGTLPTPTPAPAPTPAPTPPPPPPVPTPAPPTPTPIPTQTPVPPPSPTPAPGVTPPPTAPTPAPTPTPVPVAPPKTVAYDWGTGVEVTVPILDVPNPPAVTLDIAAQSMSVGGLPTSAQVTVAPVPQPVTQGTVTTETVPDAPTLVFSGRAVEITVFGQTAGMPAAQDVTSQVRFNPPLEIAFDITDAEWEAAGGDISLFQVRFFSVQLNRWIELGTEVDPFPPRRARARVVHLTTLALFVEKPVAEATPTPLPIEGGDFTVGTGALALLGLLGLILIATGAYYLRGSRQQA